VLDLPGVRLFADERERGWIQQLVITVLAATASLMAVVLLAVKGGPVLTRTVSLYQFLGYCLLVICSRCACWPRCSGPALASAAAECRGRKRPARRAAGCPRPR